MAVGDFNEDGHPDLLMPSVDGLAIYLGVGDGSFVAGDAIPPIGAGGFPVAFTTGDFNGDGHLDFALLVSVDLQVSVAIGLGDGDGHFTGPLFGFGGGFFPVSIAAADFDGDGALDVAIGTLGGVQVFLGDGKGGLAPPVLHSTPGHGGSVAIGDFNEDGIPDLAVAVTEPDAVSVFLGDGTGDFGPPQSLPADFVPQFVAVADWNRDGHLDIAVVADYGCDLAMLVGDGSGGFSPGQTKFIATRPPNAIPMGDFDNDGVPDLVILSQVSSALLLADGAGGFRTATIYLTGHEVNAMVTADFNGDGLLDLATTGFDAGDVSVILGDGEGAFGPPAHFAAGDQTNGIAAADFNEDGHIDLAVSNYSSESVSVLLGDGTGKFGPPRAFPVGSLPRGGSAGDVNGDGHIDLAVANFLSGDVSVLIGDGRGAFMGASSLLAGASPAGVLIADLDGDGKLDLASAGSGVLALSVWLGHGDGTFGPRADYPADHGGHALAVGDLNEDGRVDIAMAMDEVGVTLFFGSGTGQFTPAGGALTFGDFVGGIGVTDFNGDGHADLVATNTQFSNFGILLGDGTGAFGFGFGYGTGGSPVALVTADFDRDGRVDVGFGDSLSGGVAILLNRSFVILPEGLATGFLLTPYSENLTPLGGAAPVALSLSGTLPGGLAFDAAAATISGIPTELGTFSFSVTATDASGCAATHAYRLTVSGTRTLIVVTSSSSHSLFGQTLTLTASVTTDPPGTGTLTGTVTFTIDGVAQPPVELVGGVATLTVANLSVGTHTVHASYSGDSTHAASTSAAFPQIVLAAAVPALGWPAAVLFAVLLALAGLRLLRG